MIDIKAIHVFFFTALLFLGCKQESKLPISDEAEIIKISSEFAFTEGPTSDSLGNVYFTDQPNNRIYKYSIENELTIFSDSSGRSNGLYIDHEQNLWACADGKNQLWKFSLDGTHEVVLNSSGAVSFNGPNDVWVHQNGNVYFTDPIYQRPYWKNEHDTVSHQSFYLLQNQKLILLDSTLVQANGIVGDAKKNLLYVADIGANKTYKYILTPNGEIQNRSLFVEQGSDGLTLDSDGNLYLTGNGVDIYDQEGRFLQHLDIPEKWTANVSFGGENHNHLFITASKSLYKVPTNVSKLY